MVKMPRRKNMAPDELREWIMGHHTKDHNDCWIWNGGKNSAGYGCYSKNHRMHLVHRFSMEDKLGRKLLDTEDVRHLCPGEPNRACYNPEHLSVGTRKENMEDMVRHGHSQKGSRNYQSKLTEEDVLSIRALWGMFVLRELGEMYGVDPALISLIVRRKIWKHVTE
jgi:hypothetical protein